MWSRDSSVLLSLVCTRIIMVLAIALALVLILATWLTPNFMPGLDTLALTITYLCFCLPAFGALWWLDRLLCAIRREEVFTSDNVRCLRLISWCCFIAGIILLVGSFAVSINLVILAVLAAFFGIIMRVVKNLFAAAVALKVENDYTI